MNSTVKTQNKYNSDKTNDAKSCPKIIWKTLNDALRHINKSMDIKQFIDENSLNETVSGDSKTA